MTRNEANCNARARLSIQNEPMTPCAESDQRDEPGVLELDELRLRHTGAVGEPLADWLREQATAGEGDEPTA